MISKTLFGGISRRPSDLMGKEGSCEESLNVILDVNELAPVIVPEDKTADLVGDTTAVSTNTTDRYIYIHKTSSYENYIAFDEDDNEIVAYIEGARSTPLFDLDTLNEVYKGVTSVGNTLVIQTDKNLHYSLYKDGGYVYLGTHIPEPIVDFRAVPTTLGVSSVTLDNADIGGGFLVAGAATIIAVAGAAQTTAEVESRWNTWAENYGTSAKLTDGGTTLEQDTAAAIDAVSDFIWDQYYRMKIENEQNKIFSVPVFLRSAVKLYDGSYIYQSVPYLMHAGVNWTFHANLVNATPDASSVTYSGLCLTFGHVYEAEVTITYPNLGNWSDIVRSVDIFASTDINHPKIHSRVDGADTLDGVLYFKFKDQPSIVDFDEQMRDEILGKVNFYLMEEIAVEDIGNGKTVTLEPSDQDDLLVRPTLLDDNLSHHITRANNGVTSYNSRLVYRGLVTNLYSGHPFLQSAYYSTSRSGVFQQDVIEYKYFVRTSDGDTYTVIGKNSSGSQQFIYSTETVNSLTYYGLPGGFLYYPDPRCYKVEIYYGSAGAGVAMYSVPMVEHPGLNGSYALCSLEQAVSFNADSITVNPAYPTTESTEFIEDNMVSMSEVYNPFAMLLTNRQTFPDEVLGIATTTRALSTGQFGQFPLYVFTKGGIWAVPITGTGAMSDAVPVSRDVALSPESITPIDQAIVFVSEKGAMLLTGSDIRELSPEMTGRHYAIETDAADLLDGTDWEMFLSILSDTTPFMTFMQDARCAYDYAGQRLIFFNSQTAIMRSYQYVYKLDTKSWHKMSLLQTGFGNSNVLNSYPDALMCFKNEGGVYRIVDLSVSYDGTGEQTCLRQVVITRPLDFNIPHVSKSIKKMFARGILDRSHLKTLLLGSPDGLTYHVIKSLRGPSNNIFFRIMLFGNLTPEERLSFIEMEFDARFTDKPR